MPPAPPARAEPSQRTKGVWVLVADDEVNIRDLTRRILESSGYQVVVTQNGRRAFEEFGAKSGQIRVAVLDTMMPEMTGVEAAHALRRIVPNLPILIMSGSSGHSPLPENATTLFLRKPFRREELLNALATLLNGKRSAEHGTPTAAS
jgi:CheY-like chemotaxis protein